MRRGKQVYYHESSDEDEHELANLTDSAEEIKHESDEEGDYIQTCFVEEEDILKPDISQILTWRTERAIVGSFDSLPIDNNWLVPERILYTTDMFSVVFPDVVFKFKGKWQERCIDICKTLIHYVDGIGSKAKVKYGIYFLAQFESTEEELAARKHDENLLELDIILNRIYGGIYKHPNDFWRELGLLFKNCRRTYPEETNNYRRLADKLRVLTYFLYCDWYSLFSNKEKERDRRRIEAERYRFYEARNIMRNKRREEWKQNSEEIDFEKEKEKEKIKSELPEGEEEKSGGGEEEKSDVDVTKKTDTNFKDSMNDSSVATSYAFPAASTIAKFSAGNTSFNDNKQSPFDYSSSQQVPSKPESVNNMMNQQTNPSENGVNRLPSLSSLPINNMSNQQSMMNQPFRIPSMFGQNQMGNQGFGMNPMGMGMQYQNQGNNVFQGGRMINPGYMQGVNPMYQNMQMMQYPQMPGQFYGGQNQMNRPGMMNFNPNMPGFNPGMMNYGMNNQMGMVNNQFGRMMQGNYPMMPPGQGMNPMARNMMMNQNNMQRNPNKLDNMMQGDSYVPGSLEDHAISALNNADYKYGDPNDLINLEVDLNDKGEVIDPGPYNLSWLLEENESEIDFQNTVLFAPEELMMIINRMVHFDQLYLVKWMNLSYTESTWEPYSLIQQYDELIEAFELRNKHLDNPSRNKLLKEREINRKLVEYLGISEKKRKNNEDDEIDNHLKLFKYRISLFSNKVPYELYKKEKGKQPMYKKGQRLKEYQINGTNWLIKAWHDNRNIILADEMGLGKTIQTIAFMNYLYTQESIKGPFCIVAPLTTLAHWKKIVDEWTDMNAVLYYDQGGFEGRTSIRLYEWYYTDISSEGYPTQKYKVLKFNIILTSFEVFCSDLYNVFLEVPFRCIVIDEAHRLKNKAGKTLTLLKEHPCVRVFLLTGTPVQNNTKELFTLLNYIEPLRFRSMDLLLEKFGDLKNADQVQNLLILLRPYFLRRLKEEVENSIPPLEETVVEVGLTKLQTVYYKGIYGENKYMLSKLGTNSAKAIHLNNMDIQLRKCCNHLYLLKGVEEELEGKCTNDLEYYQSLLDSSGKLILLDKFIQKFKIEQSKMLIFSQFKKMLEIIEIYLRHNGVPFEVLTGSVKNQDRIMAIQRFNDDPNFGVFLLTTRAGGLGINLTSARVVVIFDSDWNPQNDLQAIARAHRIGQTQEVKVYRFITKKTYEEQMFSRASKKLGMEQALFKGSKDIDVTKEGNLMDLKPDQKEIENLLRYGAYAFIDNDGDIIEEMDINELFTKKVKGSKKKGKSLNKSTFNVDEYEKKLDKLNDEDFWKEILPSLETVSVQALEKKLKFDRADIIKNETTQSEFLENLKKLVNQLLETKSKSADVFSTEDDETRLRDLMMKFCKVHKMNAEIREEAKKLLRDLNQSIELLSYEAKLKEDVGEEEEKIKEIEEVEDKIPEDIYLPNDKRGNKQRMRRKRKVNANVVYDQDNIGDEFDEKLNPRGKRQKKNSDDGEEYVVEDHSEVVYADSKSHSFRFEPNIEDDVKGSSELAKDNIPTFEMNISAEDRTDPMYGIVPESDSSSKESMMKRELKKQQKYGTGEFSMPKMMPYNAHNIYNEPFPVFCSQCYYKVDTTYVSWICRGHCGKVYHDRCKKSLDNQIRTLHPEMMNTNREWICWFCREGKAECFICKKIDPVKLNLKKPVPSYILQKSGSSANSYSQSQYISQKDNPSGEQKDMNNDTFQNLEEESWKYPERRLQKQSSEEIMKLKSSEELGVNEFKFQFDNEVIKCYTGSCARYYHLDCLVKSKFRCLFNSLKKDEFKCSLHFCKLCGQTSENSLLMQCLKCPTSFHMKCSRADLCIQKLSRRHMICGAHYQEHISDDSDRKEDALENHSKYHSSELLEQENQNEDESVRTGERQRSAAYKIDKQRLLKSKEENEMDEN